MTNVLFLFKRRVPGKYIRDFSFFAEVKGCLFVGFFG